MKWYFAGGHTGLNFDEWACVLNPGDTDAVMAFYSHTQEGGYLHVPNQACPAHSRRSF